MNVGNGPVVVLTITGSLAALSPALFRARTTTLYSRPGSSGVRCIDTVSALDRQQLYNIQK